MNSADPKKIAAERAVAFVEEGMTVGLGTGSTAYWAIQKIGVRVREGLNIKAVASSEKSAELATELGIPIISFDDVKQIDITIDGADEVDQEKSLIKGGGGALLREKIIAANSNRFIVVVDTSKMVGKLGAFPLPIEIIPFASTLTIQKIRAFGCTVSLRMDKSKEYITDNGNLILDCKFGSIKDPSALNMQLHLIPGVVETGLFVGMNPTIIIGRPDGRIEIIA
jgi:ribose 5-phosphate isomerase A